jgi:hypothetical protein
MSYLYFPFLRDDRVYVETLLDYRVYRKFRSDRLQSHNDFMTIDLHIYVKYLRIYSYIRKPFLIYDFATDPI